MLSIEPRIPTKKSFQNKSCFIPLEAGIEGYWILLLSPLSPCISGERDLAGVDWWVNKTLTKSLLFFLGCKLYL